MDASERALTSRRRWARAIPTLGVRSGPAPSEGTEAAEHQPVWPLLVRAWPYLNRYIQGRWRHFGASPADEARGGLLYMPLLVTALWLAMIVLAPAHLGQRQAAGLHMAQVLGAVGAVCAWLTCVPGRRVSRIAAVLGLLGEAVALFAMLRASPGLGGVAAAAFVAFVSGWFVRIRVRDGVSVSVRLESHLIYFYLLTFVALAAFLLTTLLTSSLLFQGILVGQPLAPGLAALIGQPHMAHGTVVNAAGAHMLGPEQRHVLMTYLIGVGIGLYFVIMPFEIGVPYYATWVLQKINQSLRLDLLRRWSQLSPRYHTGHRVGDSIYRSYLDSAQITNIVGRLYSAVTDMLGIVQFAAVLALFDLRIAALGLGMILPITLVAWWYAPRLKARATAAREANSDLVSRAQEVLAGIRVIKAYGQEEREQDRFEADSVAAFDAALRARWFFVVTGVFAFTVLVLFIMPAQYLMAVWAAHNQAILAGAFFALLGLSYRTWNLAAFNWGGGQLDGLANKLRGLNTEWASMQDNMMGLRRVFEILDAKPEIQDTDGAEPFEAFRREVRFEKVCFAYEPGRPTLTDISFSAAAGTTTAIVGPTGSGKSTLVTLLLRIYDPDDGRILIDGRDVRAFKVNSLRDAIAVAPQEPVLFAQSITDNIRYAAPDCGDDRVRAAAAVACADDFVEAMPEGYGTVLGDRGESLSHGQRQRLCIARALIRDAPILILDEPTSALDAETEQAVIRNLAAWRRGRAVFVVTHRLSTIRAADQILFIEDGRLVEAGSHDALMATAGGRYRAMVEAEAGLNAMAEATP
jgi:ABC-type multidrug transport system fused ATPase/permease subunit